MAASTGLYLCIAKEINRIKNSDMKPYHHFIRKAVTRWAQKCRTEQKETSAQPAIKPENDRQESRQEHQEIFLQNTETNQKDKETNSRRLTSASDLPRMQAKPSACRPDEKADQNGRGFKWKRQSEAVWQRSGNGNRTSPPPSFLHCRERTKKDSVRKKYG